MRALGHVLIAAGATVALVGLARWFWLGDADVVTVGAAVMAAGFVLPRCVRMP